MIISLWQSDEPQIQSKALAAIPVGKLQAEAAEAVQLSLEMGENPRLDKQDALAKALLSWFKKDFFSWVSSGTPSRGSRVD